MLMQRAAWISKHATYKVLSSWESVVNQKSVMRAVLQAGPELRNGMQTRWIYIATQRSSTQKPLSSIKTESDASEQSKEFDKPEIELENLSHFRAKQSKFEGTTTEMNNDKGISMLDPAIQADILEAKGMNEGGYRLPHPIWNDQELESVKITHEPPLTKVDKLAYYSVKTLRAGFDFFSGYTLGTYTGRLDEKQWLRRIIFLETVAGVPVDLLTKARPCDGRRAIDIPEFILQYVSRGMVGAMVRHLISLRKLKRDHGWIHTLLEEAENERMHLMTAMRIANPGIIMKTSIMLAQGVFVTGFSLAYMISPRFCHRFVGYLEEEAVKTYTHCLTAIDSGELKMWKRMKAPEIAIEYWKLPEDAMMREVILAIRADEAHHRTVNHTLSDKKSDERNPYPPGQ